jgi:hypothetical protein
MKPILRTYNNPTLSSRQFLLAVRNAEHLPMSVRLDAAKADIEADTRLRQVDRMTDAQTEALYSSCHQYPADVVDLANRITKGRA